jgi:hypothetical protein
VSTLRARRRAKPVAPPTELAKDWRVDVRRDVVREDRPDPEAPKRTIRGGRRMDGLLDMHTRKQITDAQWTGAERFRDDLAVSQGARIQADQAGIRVVFSASRYGPTERQLDAQARVRGAWQATGLALAGVVSWVIVSGASVSDYAQAKAMRKQRACDMLDAALDRLAVFYSGEKSA